MSLRCSHSMMRGCCVLKACPHWDGAGRGAKQQERTARRTCATCPQWTTRVHCTACSKLAKVKGRFNQDKRLQREGL